MPANGWTARKQRIIQWVTGGTNAVAVGVEAVFSSDDPSEPCLTPETVRYLEELAERSEAGDVDALQRAGTVYLRMGEQPTLAPAGAGKH